MMREFEIVFWAALNTEEDIESLIKKNEDQANADQLTIQAIRSRLMLTAYSTKGELSDERTDAAVKAFFSEHFGHFVGKQPSWLLLDEPSSS